MPNGNADKSLESWIWDAACAIRGEQDAPKFKDYILPLIFVKRLCDVFDDEVAEIAKKVGSKTKALNLIEKDKKIVRFYLPLRPANVETEDTWSVVRKLADKIGQKLTDIMRDIANHNSRIKGIIDRVDFNSTTHGQREISEDGLSRLIEKVSLKRLGLKDVEADIIGRSYEYLIRKFAEGGGQSAGEFYTPKEVAFVMARIMDPQPGLEIYDPCCGSAGLLVKCQLVLQEKMQEKGTKKYPPLQLYGQESIPGTWAMANMNMVIHDMQGTLDIGDTMKNPKFKTGNRLKKFDRVVANPMWNQDIFTPKDYENDELDRFKGGIPNPSSADWGWMQHILGSLNDGGRAAVILDTGAATRGSTRTSENDKERCIRKWFIDNNLIEGVIYLPENLFYNNANPGVIVLINRQKSRKGILMVNAFDEFTKGTPKNYIPEKSQAKIVKVVQEWKNVDGFSRIVEPSEIEKKKFNLSPLTYVYRDVEEASYKSVDEIVDEIRELSQVEHDVANQFNDVIKRMGL